MTVDAVDSVGVFATDRDLVVTTWDPWMARATGVPAADACGKRVDELFPELRERGVVRRMERVLRQGIFEVLAPAFHKYLIPCKPRVESRHFEHMRQFVVIAPTRVGEVVRGLVITIEDVTPRLERERELLQQLGSASEVERLEAARVLASSETDPALLTEGMKDPSWRVRKVTAEGLAHGGPQATGALLEALREHHHDPSVLSAALTAIVSSRDDLVDTLVSFLGTDDADLRTYVALALGLVGDSRAVPHLQRLLEDPDTNVRFHAIEALGRIGDRSSAEPLARIAETRDFFLAFPAIDALAAIGEPSVASRLLPLLQEPDLAGAVAVCLGAIGAEDVVGPLTRALAERDTPVQEICAALLSLHRRLEDVTGEGRIVADIARGQLGPPAVAAVLACLETTTDVEAVATVAGWIPRDDVDGRLAALLARPEARAPVANVLASRGRRALQPLISAAASLDAEGRTLVAMALGRIGLPEAVPFLARLLDDDAGVAVAAAGALGSIGDRAAFEPLLALLDHPSDAVRRAAVGALNSIGHPDTEREALRRLADPSPRVRESAARIAGYFGYPSTLDALVAASADVDESVRRAAVEHLTNYEGEHAVAATARALRDPAASVRAAAARALARADDGDSAAQLLAAFDDPDPWVRYYALRSLARRDVPEGALARVARLAQEDVAPPVRIAALETLAPRGDQVVEHLLAGRDDPEAEVAEAAVRALGNCQVQATRDALHQDLRSPSPGRQRAALDAVAKQASDEWVAPLRDLADARDPSVALAAVDALRDTGTRAAVAALVKLATNMRLRPRIVAALAAVGGDRFDALSEALMYENEGIRCMVVEALGRVKSPGASRLLVSALEDPSSPVRLAAAQALGRMDLRGTERALTEMSRGDASAAVRDAARSALRRSE